MIGIYIGFGLILFAAAFAVFEDIRMMKRIGWLNERYRAERDRLEKRDTELTDAVALLHCKEFDYSFTALVAKAEVKEFSEEVRPYFLVYRKGLRYGDFAVKYIYYDRKDPDDRDYKRIHAEEVAELLNEKP